MNNEILKVENLSYKVDNKILFHDLNFSLNKNDSLLITGPSGGGKSTLLKIIARLIASQTGAIFFMDKNINDLPIQNYRQEVSYAAQSAQLFGTTVKDNLDFPFIVRNLPIDITKEKECLLSVNLPESYLSKSNMEISGGEKQRVALLRNLIFPPKILLLDEISTGLDDKTKQIIWQLIRNLQNTNEFGVISVTHDQAEIKSSKNTIVIGDNNEN